MVRQGPLVSRGARRIAVTLAAGLATVVVLAHIGAGAGAQAPAEPKKPAVKAGSKAGKSAAPAPEPIERMPYAIRVQIAIDPATRIDRRRRAALLAEFDAITRRFVGRPWNVEHTPEDTDATLVLDLENIDPDALEARAKGVDKLWLIRISAEGPGYAYTGREFDTATHRLGSLQRRTAPIVSDAPRVLFQFALDLFSPYALVGDHFGRNVSLTVRGAAIEPASPVGRVVTPGAVFHPLRVVPLINNKTRVLDIPFTYLRVDSAEATGAKCSLVSAAQNPFTNRVMQKTSLVALGIKPGKTPTKLRFFMRPDKTPAAGYVLTARSYPDGLPREVGTTDREGRITVDPSFADGLMVFRLLAGSSEPMCEFPLMPGATTVERDIPMFDPKPLAVTLETRLESMRDEVIDLVAVRARLEARLKARYDGDDWDGVEAVLKEVAGLPSRDKMSAEIATLKDQALREQTKKKSAVLTKTVQAQFTDLQALVERYLDDDLIRGYIEGLRTFRTQQAKPKAKAKMGGQAVAKSAPPPVATKPSQAAAPPPARPAAPPAQPKVPF